MTLLLVYGTRPEAIKLGPVAAELRNLRTPFGVLCTGQHTSLLAGTPAETDLYDSASLGLASDGNVLKWLGKAELAIRQFLERKADLDTVVVQGDTMSALAAARAAAVLQRTLVHVEAGVRSGDLENPWPEEGARREITQFADWHYAPTTHCFANLVAEGVPSERILVTGNPVVSALARYTGGRPMPAQPHILVTLHRRELLQDTTNAVAVVEEIVEQARQHADLQFVWPVHPATMKALAGKIKAKAASNFVQTTPLPYREAITTLATATGVLTDSGGLVEEATTLGVPNATLRVATDRPEALETGLGARFSPDPAGVRGGIAWLSGERPRKPSAIFGTPEAAATIAKHLASL